MKYSVVICTFQKRFERFFIPLIDNIKSQRDDVEIIVQVNGDYKQPFDNNYRSNLLKFLSKKSNTYPQFYTEFTSLSKMWNRGIQTSSNELCLVLNDDVSITDKFFDWIDEKVLNSKLDYFIINGIWSHFFISKSRLKSFNWFDERFLGVGWEDWDISRHKLRPKSFECLEIKSFDGEEKTPAQKNIKGLGKYTKFNNDIYKQKWFEKNIKESIQYPYFEFEQKNKHNL